MATGRPDDPTMSNGQLQSPPVPPVPRSTPEIPYNPDTFSRKPYYDPTLNGMPPAIQAMIWKKTLGEPRIVHIKYSLRPLHYAICVRSDQEAVVTYQGG
jgi:hypothetical protein